ncbi:MAG: DUF2911 domain-containing protein [Flavobacteriales bacterium]|nr:DUF2911 domain-containing protein [Flavobacteriales bacterium]
MMRSLLALALAAPLFAAAQDLPQPSPKGKVEQVVGLTNVSFEYSRPSAKGRVVFGELVPFGKLWRLGANANTIFGFDGTVVIEGNKVEAGKYSLFVTPEQGAWVFHLNKNTELWGTDGYEASQDVAVWKAAADGSEYTETLTISFDEVKDDKARVDVRWEKTRASFTIEADATEKAMANIKEAMAKPEIKAGSYNRCAQYCIDKGVNLKEALTWAEKANSMEPEKKYWMLHTLALAQGANGMTKEAITTANESMALAEKEGDNSYVMKNKTKIAEWSK